MLNGLLISPAAAAGAVGFLCSFVLYSLGLASRGKKSVAHAVLFESLRLLSPTTDSVALLAGVPTSIRTTTGSSISSATTSTTNTTNTTNTIVPKTLDERLAALELSAATISGGMVAVSAMKKNKNSPIGRIGNTSSNTSSINNTVSNQGGGAWKTLEWTCALITGCIISVVWRYLWITARLVVLMGPTALTTQDTHHCCSESDGPCWEAWVAFVHLDDSQTPIIILLAVVTWRSIVSLRRQSTLYSSPASYVTAWIFALITYFYLIPSSSPTGIHLLPALEEFSARLLLWIRLLGIRIDDEVQSLETLIQAAKLVLATSAGYLGFYASEPISTTVQLVVYQWYSYMATTSTSKSSTTDTSAVSSSLKTTTTTTTNKINIALLFLVALLLPLLILLLAVTGKKSFSIISCWAFAVGLVCLTKSLLQTHLDRVLPAIKQVLESNKSGLTSDQVLTPFTNRYQRLVDTGGKLLVLPSTLIVLLLLLTTITTTVSHTIYPVGYYYDLKSASTMPSSHRSLVERHNQTYIHAKQLNANGLVFGGSAITSCDAVEEDKNRLERGRGLLQWYAQPPSNMTMATALRNRQQPETQQDASTMAEVPTVLTSLVRHPFLTSTIARPILHLWMALALGWWCVSLIYSVVFSHSIRREIGTYAFHIQQSHKSR